MKKRDLSLLKHTLVVFSGSALASLLDYFFYLYIGRALGPSSYGVVAALLSIFFIVSISSNAINSLLIRFVSHFKVLKRYDKINELLRNSFMFLFLAGFLLFLFMFLLSPGIAAFLKTKSILPVLFLGFFIWSFYIWNAFISVINGLQRYVPLGFIKIFHSIIVFGLGAILLYFGFGINGALIALFIGTLISVLPALIYLRDILKIKKLREFKGEDISSAAFPVIFSSLILALIFNLDILLVNYFFDPVNAGHYSALSLIGKGIFFISLSLGSVILPKAAELHSQEKDASSVLFRGLTYFSFTAFVYILLTLFLPNTIITIFVGKQYLPFSPLLALLSTAMTFLALTYIMMMYNLAIKNYKFLYFLIPGVFLEILGFVFFHSSLVEVLGMLNIFMFFLFASFAFLNRKIFLHSN